MKTLMDLVTEWRAKRVEEKHYRRGLNDCAYELEQWILALDEEMDKKEAMEGNVWRRELLDSQNHRDEVRRLLGVKK